MIYYVRLRGNSMIRPIGLLCEYIDYDGYRTYLTGASEKVNVIPAVHDNIIKRGDIIYLEIP